MESNNEIKALLSLLDDPDPIVFNSVRAKLMSYGKQIVPNLEQYWQQLPNEQAFDRMEQIMHDVFFEEVQISLQQWVEQDAKSLKEVFEFLCYYRFQNVKIDDVRANIKNMYQSAWLEITSYLSPVEQLNVLSGVVHSMYKLRLADDKKNSANYYFLNYLLSSKLGNIHSLAAIYLILAELLDIPIKAINLTGQVMLGYFDEVYSFMKPQGPPEVKLLFYIDPANGMLYTHQDVDAYLKKMNLEHHPSFEQPLSNKEVITRYLEAILSSYESNELINDKEKEILKLIEIVKNKNID